ncbi:MAG TPA: hypothetical protein VE440_01745 [Gaiellaceae bacterium]|nr:hypothetical protein [Gaiellaceae bacterium]
MKPRVRRQQAVSLIRGLSHPSGWTKDLNTHGAIRADGHVLTYEEVSSM